MAIRILSNAKIYTLDHTTPVVSAIAVEEGDFKGPEAGRILAVGDDHSLLTEFGTRAIIQNLNGRTVFPGLTDAHIHLQKYALGLGYIDCETTTQKECLKRVEERARNTPPEQWIRGHGWNHNDWSEGLGNTSILDPVTPRNPAYLTAKSLHAAWINSLTLKAAKITADTPDPPDGSIQRDSSGNPTGILFEGAMRLVSQVIPEPTAQELTDDLRLAQSSLCRMGLTGAHDFDRRTCFSSLQILHQNGDLRLRVVKSIPVEDLSYAITLGLRSGFGDDTLQIGGVKAFADGALGPHTAALLRPYNNDPDNRGVLLLKAEKIFDIGRLAVENGLSLAIHAIGDWANREVITALSQLKTFEQDLHKKKKSATQASKPLRHRIEHVQLIHPDDLPYLAQLNVIASMQPIHALSDMAMADQLWGERAEYGYAWRSILNTSLSKMGGNYPVLAFGSDAPVDSPNPFWGLHAAITRRRVDGTPGPNGWYPTQKLSLAEALRGYTWGAAYAAGKENKLGKLMPGFMADLIVLEMDPFQIDPEQVRDILPVGTMINGSWVYGGEFG
jgi:predicted amidohydrolase YtcJ